MNISKALELEARVADVLKKEIPNIYITLKSEKENEYVLIIRELPKLKP